MYTCVRASVDLQKFSIFFQSPTFSFRAVFARWFCGLCKICAELENIPFFWLNTQIKLSVITVRPFWCAWYCRKSFMSRLCLSTDHSISECYKQLYKAGVLSMNLSPYWNINLLQSIQRLGVTMQAGIECKCISVLNAAALLRFVSHLLAHCSRYV